MATKYDAEDLVGRTVHYVATSSVRVDGNGVKRPDIRAMLITSVLEYEGNQVVNGIVFRSGPTDGLYPTTAFEVLHRVQNEDNHFEPATWHFMPPANKVDFGCSLVGCTIRRPHIHTPCGPAGD